MTLENSNINDKQVYITLDEDDGLQNKNKRKNLYITVGLLAFNWMLFHFTVVYFFTFKLDNILLVGIFLGLGNLFAFLFDIPLGILQNYAKPKTILLFGAISQIISLLIFGNFIFRITDYIGLISKDEVGVLGSVIEFFFGDVLNILLLSLACVLYGFTMEVNAITTISYILNNSNPSQYKNIIANNNLYYGIGSLLGLVISGFILSTNPKLIVFTVLFIIISIFYFSFKLFDNSKYTIELNDIQKFKVYFQKDKIGDLSTNIVETVKKIDLKDTIGKTKYLFLKPIIIKKGLNFKMIIYETKDNLIDLYNTLKFSFDKNLLVYWAFTMVLTFGFWDTFATTFLIDFLDKVIENSSYLLLGFIAIPAFGLQDFFGKIADKIGVYKIANIGLFLSGISLVFMGIFSSDKPNFFIVIPLALINSVGYSICMTLAISTFLESYNKSFADYKKLREINSNASAVPIKLLQNIANVIGLFLGGFIISIFNFRGFFLLFGGFILIFMIWAIKNKKNILN